MTVNISTIALNAAWDTYLDQYGNIAVNTQGAAVAQDVASAIKLFQGELYFDTTQGVPYFSVLFNEVYNPVVAAGLLQQAALTVPNVVQAKVQNILMSNRSILSGNVNILDVNGQASGVSI
jgi:hypothetical protein